MPIASSHQAEVQESLTEMGLSRAEQGAYLALLEMGRTTATPLAHALSVPLTTAQSLLQRLATMGIVEVTKQKSRAVYEAKDPQVFKILLEQRLQDIGHIIPILKELRADKKTSASIRVYTRERVADIFLQALSSKQKIVYEIVAAKDLQQVLGERFHFTKRRIEKKIQLKSLRVEAQEVKKYNQKIHERELREARFLPRDLTFQCSVIFWDDTIAFFTSANEGLAWIVQSSSMVIMQKQIFELLWSVSRKMETIQ